MKKLEEYSPTELATLATILGIIIASKFDVDQQNVVANFLFSIAQTIFIIAAQISNLNAKEEAQNASNTNKDLQKQIDELKNLIKKFGDNNIC
ncbi:hypothetical protein [Clostridium estertheticum]|uniref:hypothetical protein n=1 Tax=Clostridium estertheticum TaxID=238834 RepID=UPI001CF2B550|nr:hypothetical protein [Clostridium estertheticum]MCB2354761.1 hypothetical protein [Clostridium estertheticum]MCB2359559.1 hypothetical protein [Clostridium estertheticum]WAG41006.1 hypothetical protein LL065_22645 [Clostridium estertheticum]